MKTNRSRKLLRSPTIFIMAFVTMMPCALFAQASLASKRRPSFNESALRFNPFTLLTEPEATADGARNRKPNQRWLSEPPLAILGDADPTDGADTMLAFRLMPDPRIPRRIPRRSRLRPRF